jgi:hypothetical protein
MDCRSSDAEKEKTSLILMMEPGRPNSGSH